MWSLGVAAVWVGVVCLVFFVLGWCGCWVVVFCLGLWVSCVCVLRWLWLFLICFVGRGAMSVWVRVVSVEGFLICCWWVGVVVWLGLCAVVWVCVLGVWG
ncbi:hypothetical protein, partial [Neisseria sp. P0022.S006]|uniref:hypothetical protein n=1 Tax=Neisseria sp. P0022.S006 TaxID=3436831 RepID=UPI003F7EBC04